jgi:hypothetical protein
VFSVFKRGMVGVYQHCGEAHLHRYLAEFDFRYNRRTALGVTDTERADQLLARASKASALPIGGLVKPVTPKQKARRLLNLRKRSKRNALAPLMSSLSSSRTIRLHPSETTTETCPFSKRDKFSDLAT